LRLGPAARKQLAELIATATPLRGDFFRSVAFRYFHPDDVIGGEGTRLNGGRFVPVGVRAIYASLEEETALREVRTRKSALGGRSQINVGEYPRITRVQDSSYS
jgi:RES domain-containing protein